MFEETVEEPLRRKLVAVSRQLVALGLNRGTAGNAGVRLGERLLVTPSGVPADELSPEDMVILDGQGRVLGAGRPSSEWRLHRDVLAARPEVHAVIHTHSPFHYMIAVTGGNTLRCAPYALFGTQALSDQAVQALRGRKACLLANHGMVALGRDLDEALALAVEVESLSEMYWRACQLGAPQILSDAQMEEVIDRFRHYGRNRADEDQPR